jgi:NADPH dehydrogenase (quinone)
LSLDECHTPIHKTFQFCGIEPLETYSVHDIFKGDLDLDLELNKFRKLLTKNFKG